MHRKDKVCRRTNNGNAFTVQLSTLSLQTTPAKTATRDEKWKLILRQLLEYKLAWPFKELLRRTAQELQQLTMLPDNNFRKTNGSARGASM